MAVFVQELKKIKIKKAPQYCNILYNNNDTDITFVVNLLKTIFNYTHNKAIEKTYDIDNDSKGIVFINSKEICELKSSLINQFKHKHHETHLKHTVSIYQKNE